MYRRASNGCEEVILTVYVCDHSRQNFGSVNWAPGTAPMCP